MSNGGFQRQYLEEVLGLHVFPRPAVAPARVPVAVECEELTEFTRVLLAKVMGSIGLKSWGDGAAAAFHRVCFDGGHGREELGGTVLWHLPTLSDMLGEGPEITARKKTAWHLLQQLNRELEFL